MKWLEYILIGGGVLIYLLMGLILLGVGDALSTTSYKPSGVRLFFMWIFWPVAVWIDDSSDHSP